MANWTPKEIQDIWEKAEIVPGNDKNKRRKDQCGAWIRRELYGAASTQESHTSEKWQVDHIKPESKEGKDVVSNARPLQWYNNDCRQNKRLKTRVVASGDDNVEIIDK